jgi:hypothetical protein
MSLGPQLATFGRHTSACISFRRRGPLVLDAANYVSILLMCMRDLVMLSAAAVRNKKHEVKLRGSQDDKKIPRTERRLHISGRA